MIGGKYLVHSKATYSFVDGVTTRPCSVQVLWLTSGLAMGESSTDDPKSSLSTEARSSSTKQVLAKSISVASEMWNFANLHMHEVKLINLVIRRYLFT